MENGLVHAKRLEDNLNRRKEFARLVTTVAAPRSEGKTVRRDVHVKPKWKRHKNPQTLEEGGCTDEVTGVTLLRDDVAKARMEEMKWYEKFQAFEEVTDETCVLRTGRQPISCRWRVISKGDNERVEVRSRLVAREIKQKGANSHFAGTPPWALVRCVKSRAATLSETGKRRQLMVLDEKRALCTPTH